MSKIKSLTPKQVIMAMVEGLKNPKTEINMYTYGKVVDGVCFGCAATNAICQIFAIEDPVPYISDGGNHGFSTVATRLSEDSSTVNTFESAINALRLGCIADTNHYLIELGMATIDESPLIELPSLFDDYKLEDLGPYTALAEYQDQ